MNDHEQWRSPSGYEGRFEVSSLGRVRRLRRFCKRGPGLLNPTRLPNGYLLVVLSDHAGGLHRWLVHRLVLTTFVGPRPSTIHAAHLDGTRDNNALANLRWATPSENESDKRRHGRTTEGEKNGGARLTASKVASIRAEYRPRSPHFGLAPLARRYGVSMQHVSDIVRGNRWKHTLPRQ